MLTLFTIPKAFRGHFTIIQENAILSWKRLNSKIEIILCGNDPGVSKFVRKYHLKHISQIKHNRHGTPLLNDCFNQVFPKAKFDLLAFVNADIILLSDFLPTVKQIPFQKFLLVGKRYNLDIKNKLTFKSGWEKKLKQKLKSKKQYRPGAIDYFVFNKKLRWNMPSFAVGRSAWDNWLVYRARQLNIPVIDASSQITAIHQNHDYSHAGGYQAVWYGPERQTNWQLVGDQRKFFNLKDANWQFKDKKLRRIPLTWSRLIRSIEKFPVIDPDIGFLVEPLIFIFRVVRFIRTQISK
jgi:hypothetical protein